MKSYRIYRVAPDGRLHLGEAFDARDDHEARGRLTELAVQGQAAELWTGGRLIARLSKAGELCAGP
jgi:hypothetical protein